MKRDENQTATPIADFVRAYAAGGTSRFHMPGHKGKPFLGCEPFDITEIGGADSLYAAEGIIKESEQTAAELFGAAQTLYATEGSSQCIRAMLYLLLLWKKETCADRPLIAAARNVHKAFLYAAALLDVDVVWLWPEKASDSICSCPVGPSAVECVFAEHGERIAAVYLTSPDYLGGQAQIAPIAEICHQHGCLLAVDNAHGAYLHFLRPAAHPLDLGADICCDSAHKTLPVLTGGAYLHIGRKAPKLLAQQAGCAMELFGSTSPSYLTLASLDLCNRYLADGYRDRLQAVLTNKEACIKQLEQAGWHVQKSDPLKLTIRIPDGILQAELTGRLRRHQVECEYADPDFLVCMLTPENEAQDFDSIVSALGENRRPCREKNWEHFHTEPVLTIREAILSEGERVPAEEAVGRICRFPTVACPPAVPVVMPGERIGAAMLERFAYYGIDEIDVVM